MEAKTLHIYDRSRVLADWTCPRKRYWNYEFRDRGITSNTTTLPLFLGISIHDAMASISTLYSMGKEVDIDLIAVAAHDQMFGNLVPSNKADKESMDFAHEQSCLVEGMVRGFYKHVWPKLIAQYPKVLLIEKELNYKHDDMIFMSKPDLVLMNEDTGEVVYIEYKTTSSKREEWVNSWNTAVQLHSTVKAVRETTGIEITSVVIQGLYKGYESYGKQSSPFCYAYKRSGNPPFTHDEITYEYKPGFKRFPIWELPQGIRGWVNGMSEDILVNQFPQTPPVLINDELVDSFFRQRAKRETEIFNASKEMNTENEVEILDSVFPQKFDQCRPPYGSGCEFLRLCHSYVPDPLSQGWRQREPHHLLEKELFDREDKESQ